ncbi:MAG: DUF2336 domain-containing protein [Rhodospirillales bacterium]|nr:DUF2336 domain-containing protein [Rhodospirillales bacterium]
MIGKWFKGNDAEKDSAAADLPDTLNYEESRDLARHEDVNVRRALASRADLKPEILYYLAEDTEPAVRRAIAGNAAAPMHADLLLARDKDESVRGDLASKIAKLAPGLSAEEQDRVRKMAYEAIEILARDQAARVRQALSEALKDYADAPPAIIRQLARDAELIVSEPVLSFSPVLTDEDLIEIIAGNPPQGARAAIARRKDLREKVSDAIVNANDTDAIAALLANHSAQIREETLDRIVSRAIDIETWHAPLVARPVLPRKAAIRIARFVADSLIDQLEERQDLASDVLEEIRAVVQKRIEDGDLPDPSKKKGKAKAEPEESADEALERARQLMKQGRLGEDAIAASARGGNRAFVIAALAVRSKLDGAIVERAFHDKSAKGVAAVVWKAGLSARLAEQIQSKLAAIGPRDVLRAREDGGYPLGVDDLEWQIGFLVDLVKQKR